MTSPAVTSGKVRHPTALWYLLFTEMWERFSYFGVHVMIILYITQGLGLGEKHAIMVYASYTAFVYLLPLLGGVLADRYLGYRQCVETGSFLIACGTTILAIPAEETLYYGLGLVVIGSGLFKANLTTMIGELYTGEDHARAKAFNYFLISINVGGLLAMTTVSYVGQRVGWHVAFLFASIGMVSGLLGFFKGRAYYPAHLSRPVIGSDKPSIWRRVLSRPIVVVSLSGVAAFGVSLLILHTTLTQWFLTVAITVGVVYLLYQARACSLPEMRRLVAIGFVTLFTMFYFTLAEQIASSILLFIERNIDRVVVHYTVPAQMLLSFDPLFIIALAPWFLKFFQSLLRRDKPLSYTTQFVLALFAIGCCFFVLYCAARMARLSDTGLVSIFWLLPAFIFFTISEIFLYTSALSMVTQISPKRVVGTVVGLWKSSIGIASFVSGIFASYAAIDRDQLAALGPVAGRFLTAATYAEAFAYFAVGAVIASVLLYAMKRLVIDRLADIK